MTCLPPQVMLLRDAALWRLALSPGVRYASIVTKANQRRRMPLRLRSCAAGGFGNRTTQVRPRTCRRAAKRARRARWGRNTADASMLDSGTAERSPNDAICRRRRCVPAAAGRACAAPGRESRQAAQTPAMRRVAADPLTSAPLDAAPRRPPVSAATGVSADGVGATCRFTLGRTSDGPGACVRRLGRGSLSRPWPAKALRSARAARPRGRRRARSSLGPQPGWPTRTNPARCSRPASNLRAGPCAALCELAGVAARSRRPRLLARQAATRRHRGPPCPVFIHRATCWSGCAAFRAFAG